MFLALVRSFRLVFVSAFFLLSFSVSAQEGGEAGMIPLDDIPPPPTDFRPFDESIDEPQVTIRQEERGIVEEYRIGGQLYMLKIIPVAGEPYYLIDRSGNGQFESARPGQGTGISVPMWVIGTF